MKPQITTLLVLISSLHFATATAPRPNFVLILADDMGWSDIGCYGGEIQTPNIDKLAAGGLRFTNFYNTARCSPTRAALLTGQYQHDVGMGILAEPPNKPPPADAGYAYKRRLNTGCVTLAEVLKPAGYQSMAVGKWHLGHHVREVWPLQRGFDRFYGILPGASSYFRPRGDRGLTLDNTQLPEPEDPDYYTTDAFTDYGIEFMKTTPENEPFFLYLAFNAPHWPLHAREADIEKFVGKYTDGWDRLRAERWERQINMGLVSPSWGLSQRDDGARAWTALSAEDQSNLDYRMAVYAAQVHRMDWNIGRVVDYLEQAGKLENTVILFLSDNGACAEPYNDLGGGTMDAINDPYAGGAGGPAHPESGSSYGTGWANASNTPFRRYKAQVYEGGIATPLVVHWPDGLKTKPGSLTPARGYLTDIMPTFLELARADYPTQYNGHKVKPLYSESLVPVLQGTGRADPEWMFWEHYNDRAVRKGDWKAVGNIKRDEWELYNLATDRTESINLADEYPERVKDMAAKWEEWAIEHHVIPRFLGTLEN